jgi:hypothetical protein
MIGLRIQHFLGRFAYPAFFMTSLRIQRMFSKHKNEPNVNLVFAAKIDESF